MNYSELQHQIAGLSYKEHLEEMRADYQSNPIKKKNMHKPLWLMLHGDNPLNAVYKDKNILFQSGSVYFASLVQANAALFDSDNRADHPAVFLYSTHPVVEQYPDVLKIISEIIFSYKGMPADSVPESLREVVRIITDELDCSSVDFTVSMTHPENPDERIENIDVHFRVLMVFHEDLPEHYLRGELFPILVAPNQTKASMLLPKEYWTTTVF